MIAEQLARQHTPITMVDELWHHVEAAWASITVHAIQSPFDSMPRRISAVITARGVSDIGSSAVGTGFESRREHGCLQMYSVFAAWGTTPNSRRAACPLVWLVEGEERWEDPGHLQDFLPLNWGGNEQNRAVTCMVLKAKANDRRKNSSL
ncbi:uncharacterized protein TNCV_934441 [Trichonephila clavipes]|nr:uncharacterized protein TNCV_934441 [Trichonephila clavipes]